MYQYYEDILSRINEEPRWFDENAVPRYDAFWPEHIAGVYCGECALVEIACQHCGHLFNVVYSNLNVDPSKTGHELRAFMTGPLFPHGSNRPVADAIRNKIPVYGDPPNIGCCEVGATMTVVEKRVLQYWSRHDRKYVERGVITDHRYDDWVRDRSLEINIERDRRR